MDKSQKLEQKIKELDDWMKTLPDSRELKRAISVKLTWQGWTDRAIASMLNVSNSFISKWESQFEPGGIEGLKLLYKGAKSYLNQEHKQELFCWLDWQKYYNLSELECYSIAQFNVIFTSATSSDDLLREAKISWQKAQMKTLL